jgi:hypothetical protein
MIRNAPCSPAVSEHPDGIVHIEDARPFGEWFQGGQGGDEFALENDGVV